MQICVSGGGTGGHVYPALAVIEALPEGVDVVWAGSGEGVERELVARAGVRFVEVTSAPLRGRSPWAMARNAWRMVRGYREVRRWMERERPDVVLVTGGYVCVPVALAARRMGVPVLVYLPDLEPGWAVRFLGWVADSVAVSFEEVERFFRRGKVWTSGYPVRAGLHGRDREAARRALGLEEGWVVLVFGGSRGARSLNRAVAASLEGLLELAQVVHVTGQLDWPWVRERWEGLPEGLRRRYRVFDYLHEEMLDALAAADLVVARAGASTLGEFPAVGLPAVLVPYPYAGAHQERNAAFLVRHGAAVMVRDAEVTERLLPVVRELLTDEGCLERMREAARRLARPDAAQRLARAVLEMAGRSVG